MNDISLMKNNYTHDMNRNNYTSLLRSAVLAAAMLFLYAGAQAQVSVGGDVYGGGNLAPVGRGTTVLIDQAGATITGDVYGGGALAQVDTARKGTALSTITVDDSILVTILQGTMGGNVYGGGLGDSTAYGGTQNVAAHVYGPVHVSIGNKDGGSAVFSTTDGKGMVFGGNNLNGSPMDNVKVDIWSTAHGATYTANLAPTGDGIKGLAEPADEFTIADVTANTADQGYAIQAVYGGGNKASYIPLLDISNTPATPRSATVHIHTCDNTVKDVYGGGNAANVGTTGNEGISANTNLTVDGGRFYRIFGGGNGEGDDNPGANIYGKATTIINGGLIDMLFGGSNSKGDIDTVSLTLEKEGTCDEAVVSLFGGANESDIKSNVELTIGCGAGVFDEVYGGSNKANIIDGNVTLNVRGGTIGSVYGGSKGTETISANIGGNVTLNLYGGTITNAFGGSNVNGNIAGSITVNVLDAENTDCPLYLTNVYGAGNLTAYTPTTPGAYPAVNISHIKNGNSITGNVYGGGYGTTAIVTSNPKVTIGDNDNSHYATVGAFSGYDVLGGSVYGGGYAAPVEGNTTVEIKNPHSSAFKLFGGGANAGVTGNTTVTLTQGLVRDGLFGGSDTTGTVTGNATIALNGGSVGTSERNANYDVCGGGWGQPTRVGGDVSLTLDGAMVYSDIYGGSFYGDVNTDENNTTVVTLTSGTVEGNVYGGGLGDKETSVVAKVYGAVTVNANGATVTGTVFGCNNENGAPQSTVEVNVTSGTIKSVMGGGNLADYGGTPEVIISGGTITDQVVGGGNAADVAGSNITISGGTIATSDAENRGVYGGCNEREDVLGNAVINITGGTIGNSTNASSVFGGGYGKDTRVGNNVEVTINGASATIWGDVYGGSALGNVNGNSSDASKHTHVTLTAGTVKGNAYGGGLGRVAVAAVPDDPDTPEDESVEAVTEAAAKVNGAVTITLQGATVVGSVFGCNNVYGAPQITESNGVTVNVTSGSAANVFGGGNVAGYGGTPDVNISGGTIGNVYGGGNEAGVGGSDVALTDGTVTTGIYGGCNTSGTVSGNSQVVIIGGQVGTSESSKAYGIFGGGYGQATKVDGNVTVTLGNTEGTATPTIYSDLYGGSALGSVNTSSGNISGSINTVNTTTVNILSGIISGNVYGGGLGQADNPAVEGDQSIPAFVYGELTVNVGRNNSGTYEGAATLTNANIYGCNNVYGSPQNDVYVNVYGTHHTDKDLATYGYNDNENDATYAINQVFGGGNRATYAPENSNSSSEKLTHVRIYGCANTVKNVFGGSDAADAQGVHVDVDGGRFQYIFGGGNGIASAADVYKTTYSRVNGGHVEYYFGGSNRLGNCEGIDAGTGTGDCGEVVIDVLFNGGNMADVYAENLSLNLTCAENLTYKSVYGGCRLGSVYGNITINISGGTFYNVYGGCRGELGNNPFSADVRRFPTQAEIEANPTAYVDTMLTWLESHTSMYGKGGNIVINITGGDIGRVYGGCDLNGNVEGTITINVDSSSQSENCALELDYVYGGGNIAQYCPENSTITSPLINLINGHVNHDVFGGGRGQAYDSTALHITAIDAGLVTSNPKVEMDPAAGKDFWVKGNIYGGGEMASVGRFTRDGVGKPTACDANTGVTTVEILGGKVGPMTLAMPMDSGMVFGGSKGIIGDPNSKAPYLAYNSISHVVIGKADHSSGPLIKGSVYGGAENGHVFDSTFVEIRGGQIGIGAGQTAAYSDWNATSLAECPSWEYQAPYAPYDNYTNTTGTDGHTFYGNVFGGGSGYFPYASGQWLPSAGAVYGNTRVEITGGHILTAVYGGNELTSVEGDGSRDANGKLVKGVSSVIMSDGTVGVPRTDSDRQAHPVTSNVYGGGKGDQRSTFNSMTHVDSAYVEISGGRVYGSVFGGGEDGHVLGNAKVVVKGSATIGTNGTSGFDGHVFGGGRGFSGTNVAAGAVMGNAAVDIAGGTVLGSVYGGGELASVGINATGTMHTGSDHGVITVNISGGTIGNATESAGATHTKGGNVFGSSMGRLTLLGNSPNTQWSSLAKSKKTRINISSSAQVNCNVYGGGELGFVNDSAIVNIAGGSVLGTVYGGGYGSSADDYKVFAGRVYGNTRVDVTSGTVVGDIYGGGEMASVGDDNGDKNVGNTLVNIGATDGAATPTYSGSATIGGNIYGANNLSGTPFGNTYVHIYSTGRTDKQQATYKENDREYAIANVFGGGHEAAFEPIRNDNRAIVHVYGCLNTIGSLFGGGDAAAVYGARDTIDGGRFHFVFGGGNGKDAVADIGAGGTGLVVRAGVIDSLFGGSNIQGSINGPMNTVLNHDNEGCEETIGVFFAGSNRAPIANSLTTTIACGVGSINEIYGGCNLTTITGYATLNVYGGTYSAVYGGSKGSADVDASIDGDVTLNLYGGTITDAFGASNIKGNVTGNINVNVEAQGTCGLSIDDLYGAGNQAPYAPTAENATVRVNVKHSPVGDNGGTPVYSLDRVFGGGYGSSATVTASPVVTIGDDNNSHTAVVGRSVFGGGDQAAVVGNPTVIMRNDNSRANYIYGGGKDADVTGSTAVEIYAGTVVYDALGGGFQGTVSEGTEMTIGSSTSGPTITGNVYGGAAMSTVGANTIVIVNNGTVNYGVYGGGMGTSSNRADVGGSTRVTVAGGTIGTSADNGSDHNGVFGGCKDYGIVSSGSTVLLSGGHVGSDAIRAAGIFGGGYGSPTEVRGNVIVSLNGATVFSDIYGGSSLGSVNTNTSNTTTVNILDGVVYGDVYGGGLGQKNGVNGATSDIAAAVKGNVQVNVGAPVDLTASPQQVSGNASILSYEVGGNTYGSNVFGCNNLNGAPEGDVEVFIYNTYHVSGTNTITDNGYAIDQVFGGGNRADFTPSGKTITVHIYGCNNTIRRLFGGGNAAAAISPTTTIEGGRFYRIYGGGNGEVTAADIYGDSYLNVYGGTYNETYGASNNSGTYHNGGTAHTDIDASKGSCGALVVGEHFCGGENADVNGNVITTISCSANQSFGSIYGGCKNSNITGNVELTIEGGTFSNVYGGSKGDLESLNVGGETGHIDKAANISGSVTLTIKGGTITNAFGGSNVNGNIGGKITVIVDTTGHDNSCPLVLHNVYGSGRDAAYTPDMVAGDLINSPEVIIKRGTVSKEDAGSTTTGNVFGGGLGVAAVVTANPVVTIGDVTAGHESYVATVEGNVYGGGDLAAVIGSSSVSVLKGNSTVGTVFGGGRWASVNHNVDVSIGDGNAGPSVNGDVYGGSAYGNVGTEDNTTYHTHVTLNKGTVTGSVYGGGLGDNNTQAMVYSPVQVTVNGGRATSVYGCNNVAGAPQSTVKVDVYGTDQSESGYAITNVFGGGNRAAYGGTPEVKVHGCNNKIEYVYGGGNAAAVNATDVTIYGGNTIGNVYGGGNGEGVVANFPMVNGNTETKIYGGTIGNVFGGNNTSGNITGTISVTVNEQAEEGNSVCATSVGNIYGGGNLAQYNPTTNTITSPTVTLTKGTVTDNVYGGGKGSETSLNAGLVTANPKVEMNGNGMTVKGSIYGGGELASVGTFTRNTTTNAVTSYTANTGTTTIVVSAGTVGPDALAMPSFTGHVFGGGRGIVGDTTSSGNPLITYLNYVANTDVTISGTALVKGSVYGGAENGHVFDSTFVKIQGGQIGVGDGQTAAYADEAFFNPAVTAVTSENALAECPSWPYGQKTDATKFLPYDKLTNATGDDGHTFYGNVFGGGSGVMPYESGKWLRYAGRVQGNTRVEISGGHVLTSVYGGNECTDVVGTATVTMSGGTIGVPRTLSQITNHPVTCYLFGAGKGDQRTYFNEWTNVGSVKVKISGGIIYGSVYGGGEDGHVLGNVSVDISQAEGRTTTIGTLGTSYVDGNVFGAGRGFSGDALTAGAVCGNVTVNISGGTMLGSVYGGGRLASVGTWLAPVSNENYGQMRTGADHGFVQVNISGGTIGTTTPYVYFSGNKPEELGGNEYNSNNILVHTISGNVFGGSMGRTHKLDGSVSTIWPNLAKVKKTRVTISGNAVIRSSVYGGGEVGTVLDSTTVNILGGTIGSNIAPTDADLKNALKGYSDPTAFTGIIGDPHYHYGSVYGGGYGSESYTASGTALTLDYTPELSNAPTTLAEVEVAGRVFGNTYVNIKGGKVLENVFGGGDIASVGTNLFDTEHTFTGLKLETGTTTVVMSDGVVGPLDYTGHNAYVFAAGRGVGNDPNGYYKQYCNVGSTNLTVSGGTIYGSTFGGGADCHVLGDASTTIESGANIGTRGITTYDGNVFGGGRNYLNTNHTNGRIEGNISVTMTGGALKGSIFGGGRMALAGVDVDGNYIDADHGNITINVSGGTIGTEHADSLLICDESVGDIFGSGKGDTKNYNDVLAGRVSNATITITGEPTIRGSVYGGGEMASVGYWDNSGVFASGTGETKVYVYGSPIIGTAAEFQYTNANNPGNWTEYGDDGKIVHACTGNVFGGCQGDVDITKPHWISMGRSAQPTVVIGDPNNASSTPRIRGSVFGGAEQGLVTGSTKVTVNSGTIGTEITALGEGNTYYVGCVYGGGYGSDDNNSTNDSLMASGMVAGRVYGSTQVDIKGGHIYKNVYGGGSMANVGWVNMYDNTKAPKMHTATGDSAHISWPFYFDYYKEGSGNTVVNITGGRIGVNGNENGNVYGASRGMAGDRYQMAIFASLVSTQVNINYPSDAAASDAASTSTTETKTPCIVGSVYGGGENGHVYDDAVVTLRRGLVGGSVYGAGRGTDTYSAQLKNASTDALETVQVRDISAGKVYGNTIVNMYGGQVLKNVYGGGEMASVGKGNYHDYGETDSFIDDHKANTGKATVRIYGGTVGTDGTDNGHVYGSSKGTTFVNVNKNPRIDYSHDFFLGYVNTTDVTIGEAGNDESNPHIFGNVFGGGENGHVRFDTKVTVNSGEIGVELDDNAVNGLSDEEKTALINTPLWANRGNIFGAGRGTDFIPGTTDYCVSAGSVTCSTEVNINGGTIRRIVYGGGDMASVGPPPTYNDPSVCIVNINAPHRRSSVFTEYGGYVGGGSRGLANADGGTSYADFANCANTVVNINSDAELKNSVYGGCEFGQVKGKAQVNVNGGWANTIYCGGNGMQGEAGYLNDVVSGSVGTTELNLLSGSVNYVYGGGRRANVLGDATVNVGKNNNDGTYSGDISIRNNVYGCNRYKGSPKGNVYVNVYKTAHAADGKDLATCTDADAKFAIPYVFGGGSQADYEPDEDKQIYLTVYTCDNTIGKVFGGGDAAAVVKTTTVINGGRFDTIFAGGNGKTAPADIGAGGTSLTVHGGKIGQLFGGSNLQGTISGPVSISVDNTSGCGDDNLVDEFFGGSNEADITGDVNATLGCGAKFNYAYGGSNQADIIGNVTFTIEGGTIGTVFGGSKGDLASLEGTGHTDKSADIKDNPTTTAVTEGNVTLNLYGGTIGTVFGGSNYNGNIEGIITVNVLDHEKNDCEPLSIGTLYGSGNLTAYTPNEVSEGVKPVSPLVNVMHIREGQSITGSVYGGAKGVENMPATVTANPRVIIGYAGSTMSSYIPTGYSIDESSRRAVVGGDVYGGGDAAEVTGNTTVLVQKDNSSVTNLFGGGNQAGVNGTATVSLSNGTVTAALYGGCNTKGSVAGAVIATVTGGSVHDVYGGGYGEQTGTGDNVSVTIDGGTVDGDVYGGSALGSVNDDADELTRVWLKGGTIAGNLYGGGLGESGNTTKGQVNGRVEVLVNGGTVTDVFGCNNNGGAPQSTVQVDINETTTNTMSVKNVYGGGNHAGYNGTPDVNIISGTIDTVFGGGNDITVDGEGVGGSDVSISGGTVTGDVYGGCNQKGTVKTTSTVTLTGGTVTNVFGGGLGANTAVTGKATVDISGNASVTNDVYGGGNEGTVNGGAEVKIH